jgi:hypothetical protein
MRSLSTQSDQPPGPLNPGTLASLKMSCHVFDRANSFERLVDKHGLALNSCEILKNLTEISNFAGQSRRYSVAGVGEHSALIAGRRRVDFAGYTKDVKTFEFCDRFQGVSSALAA